MSQKRDAMELFIDLLLLCISLSTRHIVLAQYDQYACPPGWEEFTGYCYQFVKDPRLNRANYMKECTTNGAYGTSVLSAEEHNFISQQLEIYDSSQIKQSWWTSGKRITDSSLEFFWEGDGSKVEAYYYWLDETELSDLTRNYIIYSFDGYKWGWSIANQTVTYPYICKILKEDIYKIQEKARGPDYGVANTDSETIERGPSFIEEPSDVIYDEASVTKYTQINCEADAYPPPSYEWYKWRSNVEEVIDSTTDIRYTMVNGKLIIHIPSVENKDDAEYHCRPYNKFGKIRSQSANLGFGYLLDFPKSPRSPVTATAYQWIQIECSPPRHYPDILYTWYKNDIYNFINTDLKPYIFISHDSRLYFSEVTSDDEGYYYCLVYTPGQDISQGKVSMPTELRVVYGSPGAYEPVIGSDFPSIYPRSPLVGDNIRIECWAYGTSIPDPLSYYWVKLDANDNEVSLPTQSYVTDNNRVLIIPNVHVYDAGKYRCHCQRINGQMTAKTVELTLKARPYFTLELEDQYVDEATELRWRCEAGGDPSPSYFWLKNGIILNNSTIPSSDQGRVIVSNNMLIIKNLEASKDDGMYQCGANNSYATRYSSAQLKVLGFAPTFEKYPMQPNQYATIAGNTTLMCQPEAAPYPTIDGFKWYKNGVQLNPGTSAGSRLLLLPNGNLFINSVQQTDQGLYKCEASNNYGKASTQGNLTVLQTTTISLAPQDRTVEVNKTTFLHCMASHNPLLDVTYTWYHGTRMIEFQKYFWIGETQYITWYNPYYKRGSGLYYGGLYIMYAQHEHKGDYTCWVESTIDRFSQSAKIEIVGPPSEPVGVFVDLSSITATSVKIQWKAGGSNGKDIISYVIEGINTYEGFWKILHTNVPHEPSDDDTLYYTVTNLHPNSNYRLRVRAENELGTSEPSPESDEFLTLPITPTKYPEQVGGGGGKIGTLTITWKRLELWEQNGPGIGYIVKWKEAGDSDWDGEEKVGDVGYYVETNDIGQDNYYNEYDVLVQAFNDAGLGPVSPVVRIRSAMGLPTGIPTNILVEPFNATCCIVHWNPVEDSKDYMKGKLGGYRVSYWRSGIEDRETSFRVTVNGQITEAYIIGLYPNTQYEFDVMVWNEAGNGPRSQSFKQKTLRDAPLYPPVEVKVFRRSSTSIWLTWRGVTTTSQEEPLWGYKVRIWRAGEDIRNATNYDAARNTELSITGLRDDVTYKLRVLGYSRGGDGTMSFPTKVFTLASSSNVKSSLFCILFAFLITLLLFSI